MRWQPKWRRPVAEGKPDHFLEALLGLISLAERLVATAADLGTPPPAPPPPPPPESRGPLLR
jgi:hypothetical protein